MTDKVYDADSIVDYKTAKRFLNEAFGKDWHDRVDVEKLDMGQGDRCVLAQLSGVKYVSACKRFFGVSRPTTYHRMKLQWPFGAYTTIDWKAKILKRRAKRVMKFRKKPVIIEAKQWFKDGDHPAVMNSKWAVQNNKFAPVSMCSQCGGISIVHGWVETLEGGHHVCPGDWIITGVKGEHYPCKPDVFVMTYEPVGSAHDMNKYTIHNDTWR